MIHAMFLDILIYFDIFCMSAHVLHCAAQRLQETEVLQSMWQVQLDHCASKDFLQEMYAS
jgi:hypothetical protein